MHIEVTIETILEFTIAEYCIIRSFVSSENERKTYDRQILSKQVSFVLAVQGTGGPLVAITQKPRVAITQKKKKKLKKIHFFIWIKKNE